MNMKVIVRNVGVVFVLMACLAMPGFGQTEVNMSNRFQINKDAFWMRFCKTFDASKSLGVDSGSFVENADSFVESAD